MECNVQFECMLGLLIVLREPFAYFGGGQSNGRVKAGIVVRRPTKYLHANRAFLELLVVPREGGFDDVAQEGGVAFALSEKRAGEDGFELRNDLMTLAIA